MGIRAELTMNLPHGAELSSFNFFQIKMSLCQHLCQHLAENLKTFVLEASS